MTGPSRDAPRLTRARRALTKLTEGPGAGASGAGAGAGASGAGASGAGASGAGESTSGAAGAPRYKAGDQIGDKGWALTALLGRGGMGSVWRAQNRRGQEGALKLMSAALSAGCETKQRWAASLMEPASATATA